jgi:hypothetical protein
MKRLALAVVALSMGACGGGGGAAIPIDDLNARVIDALCSYEVRCGYVPDKAACDESFFSRQQLAADVKAGKVIYDGKAAATCLDVYDSLGCKVSDNGLSSINQTQACKDAIKGTVVAGGACLTDEECVSESCSKSGCTATECCAGMCDAKIAAGGDCLLAQTACADDLFCRRDSAGNTAICAARIADGQPCANGDLCVAGQRCIVATGASDGVCGAPPSRGQACSSAECDSSTDICDPTSKTCVARTAVGGDCTANPNGCVPYANCDAATVKCVAKKRAGEACAKLSDCLSGVACTGGVCVPPPDEPACM